MNLALSYLNFKEKYFIVSRYSLLSHKSITNLEIRRPLFALRNSLEINCLKSVFDFIHCIR
jgi:hypothetical protein